MDFLKSPRTSAGLSAEDEAFLAQLGPEVLAHHQRQQAENDRLQGVLDGLLQRSRRLNLLLLVLLATFCIEMVNRLTVANAWVSVACGIGFVVECMISLAFALQAKQSLERMRQQRSHFDAQSPVA